MLVEVAARVMIGPPGTLVLDAARVMIGPLVPRSMMIGAARRRGEEGERRERAKLDFARLGSFVRVWRPS